MNEGEIKGKLRLKCYKCGNEGRLENQSGDKFRINHDSMEYGIVWKRRCYLGSIDKAIRYIRAASKIYSNIVDEDEFQKIITQYKKVEKKHDKKYEEIVSLLLEISSKLGPGLSYETHELLKQAKCPHCKGGIGVRYTRVGKDPNRSFGKYNVKGFFIEKGNSRKTSTIKKGVWSEKIVKSK